MKFKKNGLGITPNKDNIFYNNDDYIFNNNFKNNNRSNLNNFLIITIITLLTLFLASLLYFLFIYFRYDRTKILKNIYIEDINMEGKTWNEAKKQLEESFSYINNTPAYFKIGDVSFNFKASDFDFSLNYDKAVDKAFEESKKNFKFTKTLNHKINITIEKDFNDEKLKNIADEIINLIPKNNVKDLTKIENDTLVIYKGDEPLKITKSEVYKIVVNKFNSNNYTNETVIPLTTGNKEKIDFNKIYNQFKVQPEDAYIDNEGKIHPEKYGTDLGITIEEAKKLYDSSEKECRIPIIRIKPNILQSNINNTYFKDVLSSYKVTFPLGITNEELKNISEAAYILNNQIINNNTEFSLLAFFDNFNKNKNFVIAKSETDGIFKNEYGGGTKILASCLYANLILSDLDILTHNHTYFYPNYITVGLDANINLSGHNLKFRNNRGNKIKITTMLDNSGLTISLHSIKNTSEPTIKIYNEQIEFTQMNIIRKPNFNEITSYEKVVDYGLPSGKYKIYK